MFRGVLLSPGGGYPEGDKKTRDTTPPCCGVPQGKGAESRLGGETQELSTTYLHTAGPSSRLKGNTLW